MTANNFDRGKAVRLSCILETYDDEESKLTDNALAAHSRLKIKLSCREYHVGHQALVPHPGSIQHRSF